MIKKIYFGVIFLIILLFLSTPGFFILEKNIIPKNGQTSQNNKYITYYINLDRSPNRRIEIEKEIKNINTEKIRITAIDAQNIQDFDYIDFDNLNRYPFRAADQSVSLGAMACMLSHKKVWNEFLQSNYEYALILEDDATFDHKQINEVMSKLPQYKDKWDIVKLSYEGNSEVIHLFNIDKYDFLIPLSHTDSTAAYIINKKAASSLIEHSNKFKTPADYYIERNWELGLKLILVNPNIVQQRYNHTSQSTISTSPRAHIKQTRPNSFYVKYLRPVENNMFNIKRALAMYFHGLYTYTKMKINEI